MSRTASVIISTYNARDTLARVIDAYQTQSVHPSELLIADDGSCDGTQQMVQERAATSPFVIRHVWQHDRGFRLARIRNLSIKECQSDYVIFTDGDCIPHPRLVEDHLRLSEPGYFVQGKRMFIGQQSTPRFSYPGTIGMLSLCIRGHAHGVHHLIRAPGFFRTKKGLRGTKTANFALFRSDFLAVNGFNEDFVGWGREDSELVARLYKYGLKRKDAIGSALVFHLYHSESDKQSLPENDRILQDTILQSGYRCLHGIESYESDE